MDRVSTPRGGGRRRGAFSWIRPKATALLLLVLLVAAACGSPAEETAEPPAEADAAAAAAADGESTQPQGIQVTPLSAILAPGGDPVPFTAVVADDPGAVVEWEIRDAEPADVVELSPDGNTAKVSPGSGVGSAMLTASHAGMATSVSVTVAEPGSSTVIVPPGSIACDAAPPAATAVVLELTELTKSIQVGGYVVSGVPRADCDGFIGRVENLQLSKTHVTVFMQKAALAEAFDSYVTTVLGDILDAFNLTTELELTDHCTAHGQIGADIGVVNLSEIPIRVVPYGSIRVENGTLEQLEFSVDVTTDLSVTGPIVTVTGTGSGRVVCSADLPEITLRALAIGPFTIRPAVRSNVTVNVDATITGTATVRAAGITYGADGSYGVRYHEGEGWSNTSSQASDSTDVQPPQLDGGSAELSIGVDARIAATASLAFGTLGLDQAVVDFANASVGVVGTVAVPQAALDFPIPPPDDPYQNPRWGVAADGSGHVGLDHPWAAFLPCIASVIPEVPPDFEVEVFSFAAELGDTPGFLADAVRTDDGVLLIVDGGELTPLERLVYAGANVEFWNVTPPAPTSIGVAQLGPDGRAEYFVPDDGTVIFSMELTYVDNMKRPPSPSWFPLPAVPGHSYAVGIESPGEVAVSARLDPSMGFCATGVREPSCRSAPRVAAGSTFQVTIAHNQGGGDPPSIVTVYDMGRGLAHFRGIVDDRVFAPVSLEQQTQVQNVPARGG